jgi:hypothetical protein
MSSVLIVPRMHNSTDGAHVSFEEEYERLELALSGHMHIITACQKAVICKEQPTTRTGPSKFLKAVSRITTKYMDSTRQEVTFPDTKLTSLRGLIQQSL